MLPAMNANLVSKIETVISQAHGWCTLEKAMAMAGLILGVKPAVVVELGVFGGKSLIPQALALQSLGSGVIYGIDPWENAACVEGENDKANDEWWQGVPLQQVFESCQELMRRFELSNCHLLRQRSERVATTFGDEIAVLHVDGNHSELASCRDVELWLPKVRPGGFVWADDANWPTTQKALGMIAEKCAKVAEVNHCALFVKV
jgi:hypothetical protein